MTLDIPEDLKVNIGDISLTLRADFPPIKIEDGDDFPGIEYYVARRMPPDEKTFEQYIMAALPQSQRKQFAAMSYEEFPRAQRQRAASAAYMNTLGVFGKIGYDRPDPEPKAETEADDSPKEPKASTKGSSTSTKRGGGAKNSTKDSDTTPPTTD